MPWLLSCNALRVAGVRLAVPWLLSCNALRVAGVRLAVLWLVFFNSLRVAGVRLAKETAHLAGDSWQQGGTILLDKDEKVLYQVPNKQNPAGIGLSLIHI